MKAQHLQRRRRPTAVRSAGALAALVLLAVHTPSAAGVTAAAAPLLSTGAQLSASKADLTALTYAGTVTVATVTGPVETIELTSTAASLTDLQLQVPCTPVPALGTGMSSMTGTGSGATSDASAGLTVYATSVSATTAAGTSVTWTPQSPPPATDLGDQTLTDVTIALAGLSAPSFTAPGLAQSTQFCSTG